MLRDVFRVIRGSMVITPVTSALEEHDDPKMGPVLQAAQARADTKAVIAGMRKR